jgi:hypothetical protein
MMTSLFGQAEAKALASLKLPRHNHHELGKELFEKGGSRHKNRRPLICTIAQIPVEIDRHKTMELNRLQTAKLARFTLLEPTAVEI